MRIWRLGRQSLTTQESSSRLFSICSGTCNDLPSKAPLSLQNYTEPKLGQMSPGWSVCRSFNGFLLHVLSASPDHVPHLAPSAQLVQNGQPEKVIFEKKKSRNRLNKCQSARTNLGRYRSAVLSRPTTTWLLTASAATVCGHVWCLPSSSSSRCVCRCALLVALIQKISLENLERLLPSEPKLPWARLPQKARTALLPFGTWGCRFHCWASSCQHAAFPAAGLKVCKILFSFFTELP